MDEHVLQAQRNYCVPACIVMIELWRGQTPGDPQARQHQLFESYGDSRGLCSLPNLHDRVGRFLPWFDVTDPDAIELFAATLDDDNRAIISCLPDYFGRLLRDRAIESPYGQLPDGPLPYHALCVTGRTDRNLHLLDPWSWSERQPITLRFEEFAEIWTGHVLLVPRTSATR